MKTNTKLTLCIALPLLLPLAACDDKSDGSDVASTDSAATTDADAPEPDTNGEGDPDDSGGDADPTPGDGGTTGSDSGDTAEPGNSSDPDDDTGDDTGNDTGDTGDTGETGETDGDTGPVGTWDGIDCGDQICSVPGEFCCQGLNSASCDAAGNANSCGFPAGAPAFCDGPEDCPGGGLDVCCANAPSGTFCQESCDPGPITFGGAGKAELCHDASQCGEGLDCIECFPPMGPSFMMCATSCEDRGLSSSGG
jgi:hypothetical protein